VFFITGGHYTAYAFNAPSQQWYEFDDQYVTEVDLQQVENCEAYVLFYRSVSPNSLPISFKARLNSRKKNEFMLPLRQKAEQLRSAESSFLKFYISKLWLNMFNTFAEPGPICNHDFACAHGGLILLVFSVRIYFRFTGVHPYKWPSVEELVEEIPQKLWEYLYEE
jgi:ubiquitin carboxyl-terminal hydrolase 20/33